MFSFHALALGLMALGPVAFGQDLLSQTGGNEETIQDVSYANVLAGSEMHHPMILRGQTDYIDKPESSVVDHIDDENMAFGLRGLKFDDHEPTATPPVVTQISDGQVQAPTSTRHPQPPPPGPPPTPPGTTTTVTTLVTVTTCKTGPCTHETSHPPPPVSCHTMGFIPCSPC